MTYRESAHEAALQRTRDRKARAHMMPCRACGGTGRVQLYPALQVTLDAVGSDWTLTGVVWERLGGPKRIKNPALCNRLADLRGLGLVESRHSERNFKMLEWRRTPCVP